MNAWKGAALTAALLAAAGMGTLFFPPAHAQSPARAPRALEVFGGRGSQIGVTIRDVEEGDAKTNKLSTPSGVLIEEVSEDSPAATAGLKKGDVVVEFDGERVRSVRQFTRLVQETPAGRRTAASVMRDGQRINVTIEPREGNGFIFANGKLFQDMSRDFRFDVPRPIPPTPPATPKAPVPPAFPDFDTFLWSSNNNGLGITVGDLSQQLAEYFGTKDGVLVTSVADNSAASKAGIKAGDVITTFNGTEVRSPSDLRRRIQHLADGDEFTVGAMRDKKSLTLKGKAERLRPRRTSRTII